MSIPLVEIQRPYIPFVELVMTSKLAGDLKIGDADSVSVLVNLMREVMSDSNDEWGTLVLVVGLLMDKGGGWGSSVVPVLMTSEGMNDSNNG
jgi:predicted histidine transporter YuiF (NhaC family)